MDFKVSVQGSHSTPVNTKGFTEALLCELQNTTIEGPLELQFRCVNVPRRSRNAGLYGVAANEKAPNSIELLFFDDSSTGRPATLFLRNQDEFAAALEVLAPRIHQAWAWMTRTEQSFGIQLSKTGTNAKTKLNRGTRNNKPSQKVTALVGAFRSNIKHQGGKILYNLLTTRGRFVPDPVFVDAVIKGGVLGPETTALFINVAIQLGVIAANVSSTVMVTEYGIDLAQNWRENQNEILKQVQKEKLKNAEREKVKALTLIAKLEQQLEAARVDAQKKEREVVALSEELVKELPEIILT